MNKELQRAQDMLTIMQQQRDNALNSIVMMQADMAALKRENEALQQEVAQLKAPTPEVVAPAAE